MATSSDPSGNGSSPFSVDISALPQSTGVLDPENEERLSRAQKAKATPRKDGARPANIAVDQRSLDPNSSLRNTSAMASTDVPRSSSPYSTSPSRGGAIGRASPRHLSPATSQIFERDVQESSVLAGELSPAIPSHVTTEDHIPPVLEASTLAITDNLNPDEVEVIQSSAHQPASAAVAHSGLGDANPSAHISHADLSQTTGGLTSTSPSLPGGLSGEGFHPTSSGLNYSNLHEPQEPTNESNSAYGAVDPMDPRRLSFISFADVVHAEHAEQASHSDGLLSSGAPSISGGNRSPSPARSPVMSSSPQTRHLGHGEASPVRGGAGGSMMSGHAIGGAIAQSGHGEITIETMRQTLQKTGSNDVAGGGSTGGAGSQTMSATSAEDVSQSQPLVRGS